MEETGNTKTNNNALKAVVIILAIALVGVGFYAFSQYSENKKTEANLEEQKAELTLNLENLRKDYEAQLATIDSTNTELEAARNEVVMYLDSIQYLGATLEDLEKYKGWAYSLNKKNKELHAQIDSLRNENMRITRLKDSTQVELDKTTVFADSMVTQNTKLSDVVKMGSALNLAKLNVDAIKVRNSGKTKSVNKAKRADKLKVCFTVAPNKIAASEDKVFYVQVTSPTGAILGDATAITLEDKPEVIYSKTSEFYYEKETLDVCEYVNKPSEDFAEGNYRVTIFDGQLNILGTTDFTLE